MHSAPHDGRVLLRQARTGAAAAHRGAQIFCESFSSVLLEAPCMGWRVPAALRFGSF